MKNHHHTKGPWATCCGDCTTICGPKTNGHEQIIARCPGQNRNIDYYYKNVGANAGLIALAPVMLEILGLILNRVNKLGNLDQQRDKEIILKIKSVITETK